MLCPCCDCNTKVLDSRLANNDTMIKRRRECTVCGYRFNTYEIDEAVYTKMNNILLLAADFNRHAKHKEVKL